MELLGNHVSDCGDQEPFFGDVSRLAGTTGYRLNEMHSASLAGDSLFRDRFTDVWAVPRGSVNCPHAGQIEGIRGTHSTSGNKEKAQDG